MTLGAQLAYLEASSPFYRERLRGARGGRRGRPAAAAVHDQGGAARRAARRPAVRAAPVRAARTARAHPRHVRDDGRARRRRLHAPRPRGQQRRRRAAFALAGLRADDTVAHCLNYALYAGGIADHMALEASGATVVPVGTGQSRRLLDLIGGSASPRSSGRCRSPPTSPRGRARRGSTRAGSACATS